MEIMMFLSILDVWILAGYFYYTSKKCNPAFSDIYITFAEIIIKTAIVMTAIFITDIFFNITT